MAGNELADRLQRRMNIDDGAEEKYMREYVDPMQEFAHPYPEFSEFSREQCKKFEEDFAEYDLNKDEFLCYDDIKAMMETRGQPLTHLEIKKTIELCDEDKDDKLNFREFMLIWKKCLNDVIPEGSSLAKFVKINTEVLAEARPVEKSGLSGTARFFEAQKDVHKNSEDHAAEIQAEQRKKYQAKRDAQAKKEAEEKKKAAFAARASQFS